MQKYDAIVIGASTVGAAAALALARMGHEVALVDRKPPRMLDDDAPLESRVVAISPGSRRLLEELGGWRDVRNQRIAVYHDMQVMAGHGAVEFSDIEHGLTALGWVVELAELDRALWHETGRQRRLTRHVPDEVAAIEPGSGDVAITLSDGREITAAVLIGADGANSRVRLAAGIDRREHHYNQRALVTHLDTEKVNPGIAWQRFTSHGPLALLPLPRGRSSLVWSVAEDRAQRLMAQQDSGFIESLNRHAKGSPFGPVEAISTRHSLPLVRRQSKRLSAGRMALAGDAARSVHPLAGQGLNLGLGDIAALIQALAGWKSEKDPATRLDRYSRRRWSDSILVAGGIHAINETRGFGEPGLQAMGTAFTAMRMSRGARDLFVRRACGLHEAAPATRLLQSR